MKKTGILLLSLALFAGCSSYNQMNGVITGSMLGGLFGSSIGGIIEGPRGHDAGRALGMVIGGVAGAAATAPRETKTVSSYSDVDSYNRQKSSSRSSYSQRNEAEVPDGYDNLQIENLRFIEENNNHLIDAGERCKIVFEIRNAGNNTLYDVAPILTTSSKSIILSPTAIIASISSGKVVRYTADLYAKTNLKTGVADFSLGFSDGKVVYTVRKFQLNTSRLKK